MDMHIDTAGGDDLPFAGDHLRSRSDNYVDVRLHIRIASFAYGGDTPVFDGNVGFHNSPVIKNQRVGDDSIHRALAAGTLRLTHAVTDDFPTSELHLLAIDRKVLLNLDDKVGIREAQLVADGWAKHLRIGGSVHCVWHSRLPQ